MPIHLLATAGGPGEAAGVLCCCFSGVIGPCAILLAAGVGMRRREISFTILSVVLATIVGAVPINWIITMKPPTDPDEIENFRMFHQQFQTWIWFWGASAFISVFSLGWMAGKRHSDDQKLKSLVKKPDPSNPQPFTDPKDIAN